jgi:hypothetical protein
MEGMLRIQACNLLVLSFLEFFYGMLDGNHLMPRNLFIHVQEEKREEFIYLSL